MDEAGTATAKWTRKIDLGDGSGVQVFEADTQEGLIDKLATAQENATRKIRELNRQAKLGKDLHEAEREERPSVRTAAALTDEERLRLSQDIFDAQAGPKAIRRVIEAELGVRLDEVKSALQQQRDTAKQVRERLEAEAFMASTPDYYACRANMALISDYLGTHGMAVTEKNLKIAFEDLGEGGLLLSEPKKRQKPSEDDERIVRRPRGETATAIRQDQAAAPTPRKASGPTPEEIERMSPEEYRQRILLPQLAAQRSR